MPIYKKINDIKVEVAKDPILDHNQLSGRDAYGSHPISAIRKLPEKLTELKVGAKQISLTDNGDGTITFTNFDGISTILQGGLLPDDITIEVNDNNELVAVALKVSDNNTISGSTIYQNFSDLNTDITEINKDISNMQSIINAKGGYLDSYDFDTLYPNTNDGTEEGDKDHIVVEEGVYKPELSTLSLLTQYALDNIGITDPTEIWDKTRVINLYTNNEEPEPCTWSWDLNSLSWANLGNISFIADANNNGLHGLVTGAPDDGNHDYMGNISALGQITINGLTEFVSATNTALENCQPANLVFTNVVVSNWASDSTYDDYAYKATIELNGMDDTIMPIVILSLEQSMSGNYSTTVESYDGGIYLWSKDDSTITIPLIVAQYTN